MMSLNNILRKFIAGYKLSKLQAKIIHLMYMDDNKLFAKNERELETLIQSRENIQSRFKNGIWHRKKRHASRKKRETTRDRRN